MIKKLISEAISARKMAYTPYSHFAVGAALLCSDGTVFQGCNIENAAYTPTNCAERTAIFKAVSEGKRKFDAIAVVGAPEGTDCEEGDYCPPCGVCRQVLMEFVDPNEFWIIMGKSEREYKICTLGELLPMGFGSANLE
ncbi:MAG: cytidine deaminase [Clostridia bacterium]|nr:cytidine deaminase [Clostridia bacterium]NCC44151.1 cytidine deaminase [Clostridia bacterium]